MSQFFKTISDNNARIRVFLLGCIFILLPFELYPRAELYTVSIRLSQIVGVVLILFCLPTIVQKWRDWLGLPWVALVLFVLVSIGSAMFAISRTKGLMVTSFYVFDFVLAYVVAQTFSVKYSSFYKKIIFGVSLLVVAFCLFQLIGDTLGLSNTYTLLNIRYTKLVFGFARIQGFSLEPLYLANFLFIPFCLALVGYIFSNKKIEAALAFVFLTTIWLTVARGAYLGVIAAILILCAVMVYQKKWRQLIVTALIVGLSLVLAFGMIRLSGSLARPLPTNTTVPTNLQTNIPQEGIDANGNTSRLLEHTTDFSSETSVNDRVQSWQTALRLTKAKPLLGVGPGNFGRYVVREYPNIFVDQNQIVNNETLEILSEVGIAGLIALLVFVAWLVWRAFGYSTKHNSKDTNIWFFATTAMLVAFLVQWQTFSTLYITHIWVIIGVFVGLLLSAKQRKK